MAYEQRDNSGVLFSNDKRGNNDRAPNAKGKAMIGGKMYWVSAWTKNGNKGKFQSLSFTPMENHPDQGRQGNEPAPFGDEQQFDDSSIPF